MRSLYLSLAFFLAANLSTAQIFEPVKWRFQCQPQENGEHLFSATANIESGWHVYALQVSSDPSAIGPIPTSLKFSPNADLEILGKPTEGKYITHHDPNFEMELNYFENTATFKQKLKLRGEKTVTLKGEIEFMACNDERCIFPEPASFSIPLTPLNSTANTTANDTLSAVVDTIQTTSNLHTNNPHGSMILLPGVDLNYPVNNCGTEKTQQGLWAIFLFGIIGGLLALLTPCVFPMIPLTVSFFTKGAGGGKGMAILYGLFILLIYLLLSLPFHLSKNVDPEVLNSIATNTWLNIGFFIVFVVFAISFFGFFEITLPSSLANKADSASNIGGVIGVFFMALTLAIVSFSCTGPILGTVIGSIYSADVQGVFQLAGLEMSMPAAKVSAAMLGFGLALGAPFALFAAFPSMLKKLPKGGGWMDDFKVSLGFLELGLAVKFLSNSDLVEQWGMLKRETFFAIWILIGLFWLAYMLKWYTFKKGQGSVGYPPVKIAFVVLIAAFTLRITPGLLPSSSLNDFNFLSGFPPPKSYSWYHYEHPFHVYTNLEEAMAESQRTGKPLFLDFTGWACVNCRKMEDTVWPVDEVRSLLNDNYIMCSLYVDEKVELPADQQFVYTTKDGRQKEIKRVGTKWATLQTETFANNSQPFYALLSPDGKLLTPTEQYNPNADKYAEWLRCGLEAHSQMNETN
jgi:thiol:disulfide interchange protein